MEKPPTFIEELHGQTFNDAITFSRLGQTDMVCSKVGMGMASAGGCYGAVEEEESVRKLVTGVKMGVNYVDTAPWYGKSEEIVGKALKELPRSSYYLATKVGRHPTLPQVNEMFDFSAEKTEASFEESLVKLGVSYVDVIQIHDTDFADVNVILEKTLPTLQKFVDAGKARYIGITGYDLAVLDEILYRSTVKISTVLSFARYTLQNQDLMIYRARWEDMGVGILNGSVTSLGLLTAGTPPSWHLSDQQNLKTAERARKLCEQEGVDLARLAVAFSVAEGAPSTLVQGACMKGHGGGPMILVGCNDLAIFRRNLDAAFGSLTQKERETMTTIRRWFAELPKTHWEGVEKDMWKKQGWVTQL